MRKLGLAALAAGALLASAPASAAPVVTGTWYEFAFGDTGSALTDGTGTVPGTNPASVDAPAAPWTITLSDAALLIVTDAFRAGDAFTLADFGTTIGTTSPGVVGAPDCGSDITACLADPNFSHGSFLLAAGSHSITGTASTSPFGGGAAFFIIRGVPEPGTWALMLLGFGGIGLAMRRGRKPLLQMA